MYYAENCTTLDMGFPGLEIFGLYFHGLATLRQPYLEQLVEVYMYLYSVNYNSRPSAIFRPKPMYGRPLTVPFRLDGWSDPCTCSQRLKGVAY